MLLLAPISHWILPSFNLFSVALWPSAEGIAGYGEGERFVVCAVSAACCGQKATLLCVKKYHFLHQKVVLFYWKSVR